MRNGTIIIDGVKYPYQIIKTKNKTVRISFNNGTFVVRSNEKHYSTLDLQSVYLENSKLFAKLLKVKQHNYEYRSGEQINILGRKYLIVASLNSIVYGDSVFINMYKDPRKEFYKACHNLLLNYFKDRTEYFYNIYFKDKKIPLIKVQLMTSRYGVYHSRAHYITYSAYLAHYPLELIDYVIVHELCHINVLSHSREFYALLSKILPNYKELERRLKEERYIPSC